MRLGAKCSTARQVTLRAEQVMEGHNLKTPIGIQRGTRRNDALSGIAFVRAIKAIPRWERREVAHDLGRDQRVSHDVAVVVSRRRLWVVVARLLRVGAQECGQIWCVQRQLWSDTRGDTTLGGWR